ncbi:hypothetical protein BJ912DRAFT_860054 [Pholiota molesta]|nr:hypothetical protein BJ912DRAFT_860054 [Pholiota molesta]
MLRIQLQLRHRLGVTVALPAVPLRLSLPPSPSAPAWLPGPHRLPHLRRPRLRLRTVVYAVLLVPPLLLALVLLYGGVPPSYADVWQQERALPQHHWRSTNTRISSAERGVRSTPPANGEAQGTYLRFPDHVCGHGLNNVLQEAILTTHLTLTASARTPVFEPYTWSRLPLPYTLYDFALRPTRVPLSAFVGGVLAGVVGVEDVGNATRTRRAVSAAYFEHVCAPSEVVEVVYGLDAPAHDSIADDEDDDTVSCVRACVRGVCIVLCVANWVFFSVRRFFGAQERIGPVLGEVLAGPVLRGFAWSPLVDRAVARSVQGAPPPARNTTHSGKGNEGRKEDGKGDKEQGGDAPMLPGVLALHLRRGDYGRHCVRLARWGAPYLGVNAALRDPFDPVRARGGGAGVQEDGGGHGGGDGEDDEGMDGERGEEERERYYLKHCLPSIEQVVRRLRAVRAQYDAEADDNTTTTANTGHAHRLKHVYVLTNGWPAFVDALRGALLADGWARVVATPDLAEEQGVSVAVDMALAVRAEVFVGNGFSSLSANIVLLRMARGVGGAANRLL